MNHEILKRVIFDMQELIRNTEIYERSYQFEDVADYILVGARRSGKSTLLYKKVRELVEKGVSWDQISYID